jgi:hypothetical protein
MQIYTKFRVFREILGLFIPIFQRFITDDIFYTQQRNFKTLIGGGGGGGGMGGNVAGIASVVLSTYVK